MDRRINISSKFILPLVVVLVVIIIIAAFIHRQSVSTEEDTLIICQQGEEVARYTLEEVMNMESETHHVEMTSGKDADVDSDFTGVMLEDLLKSSGITEYDVIVFTAGDGYSSAGDADEVADIMVSYSENGDTLGYYTMGGTGPLRCIFIKDSFGNRSIQYLTTIDCRMSE